MFHAKKKKKYIMITWSTTPASGVVVTSSPPAATSFSITFKAGSNGNHSDFWHNCKTRWAPSLMDEPGLGNVVGTSPSETKNKNRTRVKNIRIKFNLYTILGKGRGQPFKTVKTYNKLLVFSKIFYWTIFIYRINEIILLII